MIPSSPACPTENMSSSVIGRPSNTKKRLLKPLHRCWIKTDSGAFRVTSSDKQSVYYSIGECIVTCLLLCRSRRPGFLRIVFRAVAPLAPATGFPASRTAGPPSAAPTPRSPAAASSRSHPLRSPVLTVAYTKDPSMARFFRPTFAETRLTPEKRLEIAEAVAARVRNRPEYVQGGRVPEERCNPPLRRPARTGRRHGECLLCPGRPFCGACKAANDNDAFRSRIA